MKTLGEIIVAANVASKPGAKILRQPSEPRLHRVVLVVKIVADIEVTATTPEEAFAVAERRAKEATRRYRTEPIAVRASVRKLVDPRDASQGHKWARLERTIDEVSGCSIWAEGKDDVT